MSADLLHINYKPFGSRLSVCQWYYRKH